MIRFTEHAKERIADYEISKEDVENVLKEPEKTERFVAVKSWKDKHLIIVFERNDTVFPTSKKRVESGRWIEL